METKAREILKMCHIDKNFPGVKALSDVDFTLCSGEIHALMGENGAGKSTLIKVLTGAESFETGDIWLEGHEGQLINKSPQEAQENGISTVYQEVNLCDNLSVAENLFIGREPKRFGYIDWKTMNRKSRELLAEFDIYIDVTVTLDNYSLAIQQMIAIARAVDISAKVLILDEPTSSLDDVEVEMLFKVMRMLKDRGMGIIFVTHFLEQVYAVCDTITVLRNGQLVGAYNVENLPRLQLVAAMMGKDFDDLAEIDRAYSNHTKDEQALIEAKSMGLAGKIKPFDLDIYKGDVIGLSGLLGSGRSELARLLYGADKSDTGVLKLKGHTIHLRAPIDAIKRQMAFLPEDRKAEGILADLSVRENIILALQAGKGTFKLLSKKEQEDYADQFIDLLNIKTASKETPIKQLSGGNQQKVILARWLLTDPDFLILDEPTRGIDVGTKSEIQKLVVDLALKGKSIMFISSEIEEMLRTCNRMIVLRDQEVIGELSHDEISEANIMAAIAGGHSA